METSTENIEQEIKLYAAVVENSFSDEEMDIIIKKLKSIPEEKLPRDQKGIYSITFKRYQFLREKYREMKKTDIENGLGNRFECLISLL